MVGQQPERALKESKFEAGSLPKRRPTSVWRATASCDKSHDLEIKATKTGCTATRDLHAAKCVMLHLLI
eukprot:2106171-Pleurochrysis_carterae.AAC.3